MLQVIIAVLGTLVLVQWYQMKKKANFPPGPKGLPLIGNIMDLPPTGLPEYQHWLKFKDAYGPISSVTVLGTTLVIIHDKETARDILEKTSSKTSSRPSLHFGSKLCGYEEILSFMSYNSTFRQHRKLVHQQLGTKTAVSRFRDIEDVESRRFLLRILNDSANVTEHIKTYVDSVPKHRRRSHAKYGCCSMHEIFTKLILSEAGAIILQIVYGYSIEPQTADPLVLLIERLMQNLSDAFVPLSWAVDILPILNYLPEGVPGTSFKKTARKWKEVTRMVIETPYEFVRQQMAKGSHRPSYVASLVEEHDKNNGGNMNDDEEKAIKSTAAIMYAGGADTTVSSIKGCILAMMLYPSVQRKAQAEIDAVIGDGRLPQFEDRQRLPYVDALVKETLRWLPVTPMGAVHLTDTEIYHSGFRIPKGANLLPAVWWFLHDPHIYSDPASFEPDRYLEPRNEPDPATEAFGYGRRICPGRFLADESLFLTISRLLAVFDITKAVDENGKEIDPEIDITPGLIGRPLDFPYCIRPRSAKSVDLIRTIEVEHPLEKGDASLLTGSLLEDS